MGAVGGDRVPGRPCVEGMAQEGGSHTTKGCQEQSFQGCGDTGAGSLGLRQGAQACVQDR